MTLPPNTTSSVTKVHEARRALGLRLRELRRQAGLTGAGLAASLSWPASKVSKLENGRQTPTDDDILAWTGATGATGASAEAEGLLASLHTLELQYAEWQRVLRPGLGPVQRELADVEEKTKLFRVFEASVVPGLLQTGEYARARFMEAARLFGKADDVDEAVRARLRRQEVLYRPDRRLHFVVTEAALRFRRCSDDAMLAQLERLVALTALRNVKLGIIGFDARFTIGPWHGFWLLDDDLVTVETFSAELNLAQPQEIEVYRAVFDQLAAVATYGSKARAIILRVIDDLAARSPEDGS
jgi:transcriptional regulator with XRE-family HTH domain